MDRAGCLLLVWTSPASVMVRVIVGFAAFPPVLALASSVGGAAVCEVVEALVLVVLVVGVRAR